jgi:hypothetical protein
MVAIASYALCSSRNESDDGDLFSKSCDNAVTAERISNRTEDGHPLGLFMFVYTSTRGILREKLKKQG